MDRASQVLAQGESFRCQVQMPNAGAQMPASDAKYSLRPAVALLGSYCRARHRRAMLLSSGMLLTSLLSHRCLACWYRAPLSSLSTFTDTVIHKIIFEFVRGADSLGGFGWKSKRFVLGIVDYKIASTPHSLEASKLHLIVRLTLTHLTYVRWVREGNA